MPGRHPAQIGMKKAAAEFAFSRVRGIIHLIVRHPGIDFDCIHPFASRCAGAPIVYSRWKYPKCGSLCGPICVALMVKSGHFRFFHTKTSLSWHSESDTYLIHAFGYCSCTCAPGFELNKAP